MEFEHFHHLEGQPARLFWPDIPTQARPAPILPWPAQSGRGGLAWFV